MFSRSTSRNIMRTFYQNEITFDVLTISKMRKNTDLT